MQIMNRCGATLNHLEDYNTIASSIIICRRKTAKYYTIWLFDIVLVQLDEVYLPHVILKRAKC